MVNSLHTQANRERVIDREQTSSGTSLPFKSILNNAWFEAQAKIQIAKSHNDRKAIKEWETRKAEAAEQLRILKAFDADIVALMGRVAVRNFREQTRRMKVEK